MPKSEDVILWGAAAIAGFYIYNVLKPKQTPGEIAAISAAVSAKQKVTLPNGNTYQASYVNYYKDKEQESVVIQKVAPLINDNSQYGLAVTSLTPQQYANLSANDRRVIEKGVFQVTSEGMLITGWDRLLSLLPTNVLRFLGA